MIEPPRPTDAEMAVYDAGKIDGVNRSKPCEDMPQSMYELWRPSKAPIYLTPDEAEQILCFDPHQPGVLQIQPDVITKCEAWLAWKAEQDERLANSWPQSVREDCASPLTTDQDHVTHVVFDDKTFHVGEEAAFVVDLRRILREELARAIDGDMTDISDAIERLRREYSERK